MGATDDTSAAGEDAAAAELSAPGLTADSPAPRNLGGLRTVLYPIPDSRDAHTPPSVGEGRPSLQSENTIVGSTDVRQGIDTGREKNLSEVARIPPLHA